MRSINFGPIFFEPTEKIKPDYPFPQLCGGILFVPPDARAIILHNDLLCNVVLCNWWVHKILDAAGGGGGTNGKDLLTLIAEGYIGKEPKSRSAI